MGLPSHVPQQLVPGHCEVARGAGWVSGGWTVQAGPLAWVLSGSGPDGAEEIKRHVFYSTIDWNVSVRACWPWASWGPW